MNIFQFANLNRIIFLLNDISVPSSVHTNSEDICTNSDTASYITSAESNIQQVIGNVYDSRSDDELIPWPEFLDSILFFASFRRALSRKTGDGIASGVLPKIEVGGASFP